MIHAPGAELLTQLVSGRETKVGDSKAVAVVEAENVLWLEVAVIDTKAMAILNCVKQLQEDVFDQNVVAKIAAIMEDLREQVVVRGVVQDNIRPVVFLDDAVKGDDVRV